MKHDFLYSYKNITLINTAYKLCKTFFIGNPLRIKNYHAFNLFLKCKLSNIVTSKSKTPKCIFIKCSTISFLLKKIREKSTFNSLFNAFHVYHYVKITYDIRTIFEIRKFYQSLI